MGPDGVAFELTRHTQDASLVSDITLDQNPIGAKPSPRIIIGTTYKDDEGRRHPVRIVCKRK